MTDTPAQGKQTGTTGPVLATEACSPGIRG